MYVTGAFYAFYFHEVRSVPQGYVELFLSSLITDWFLRIWLWLWFLVQLFPCLSRHHAKLTPSNSQSFPGICSSFWRRDYWHTLWIISFCWLYALSETAMRTLSWDLHWPLLCLSAFPQTKELVIRDSHSSHQRVCMPMFSIWYCIMFKRREDNPFLFHHFKPRSLTDTTMIFFPIKVKLIQ